MYHLWLVIGIVVFAFRRFHEKIPAFVTRVCKSSCIGQFSFVCLRVLVASPLATGSKLFVFCKNDHETDFRFGGFSPGNISEDFTILANSFISVYLLPCLNLSCSNLSHLATRITVGQETQVGHSYLIKAHKSTERFTFGPL